MRIKCTCPAGVANTMCKHREGVLHGDCENVTDGIVHVPSVANLFKTSQLEPLFRNLKDEEHAAATLKKKITALKKQIAREMG